MGSKRIKYEEGQWFAVPLYKNLGFAIGIVARGCYKNNNRGIIGYFFAPNYPAIPDGQATFDKTAENAIYICWFAPDEIRHGEWPLIQNGKPYVKSDWPVPLFYRENPAQDGYAIVGEYDQDNPKFLYPIQETILPLNEVDHYPIMGFQGTEVVKSVLTRKISKLGMF
jgi:hypothetical protein